MLLNRQASVSSLTCKRENSLPVVSISLSFLDALPVSNDRWQELVTFSKPSKDRNYSLHIDSI